MSTGAPDTHGGAGAEGMASAYDPQAIERRWYEWWEEQGLFRPSGRGEPYCIMLPPPNVTGSLHMGHAFQDTIMDALVRFHRMRGFNTLWQCGTDHAGIATQMVVERQLAEKGRSRHGLGREAFEAEVWRWKEESGGQITRQMRRLGASVDWSRERFTLDEGLSRAVTEVFVTLYEKGLLYRGQRLVNWDPVLHTAISDLEVISEEEQGRLWHIRYPLADGGGHLVVATTRPETLLGDCAVAVHPEDERYRALVGREVELPLTGRRIPIIADEYVDPEFGSGAVKITPAHDFNDYEVWLRHRDEPAIAGQPHGGLINIFTPDAAINDEAPEAYRGLDRFEARERVVADLQAQGLLERVEPHRLMVPRGDRSHAVVEPYLTDQWFVRVGPLARAAIAAVEDGRIRFVPESWSRTYFEWMRNIQDWCVSRQLWWGHRIPAWYDDAGKIYVGRSEAEVRERHGLGPDVALERDPDVLDTWFSSALWPFSTLGWPEPTPELETFYPTSVLVTGFDIIFFWVARMIMMGLEFAGDVPFREVYIHGLVRDADGQKMSKSKGNILDPIDLIDGVDLETLVAKRTSGLMRPQDAPKIEAATRRQFPDGIPAYGADALRYTFASLATQGRDIRFDLGRCEGYRNFCNKIWNAARFVLMTAAEGGPVGDPDPPALGVAERWITSRLGATLEEVWSGFGGYRFDLVAAALHHFFWDEYCDWYLETAKVRLRDDTLDAREREATRAVLVRVLEASLRAIHPLMPFISEEIWQRVAPLARRTGRSVSVAPYPAADEFPRDAEAEREYGWLQKLVLGVRQVRAEFDLRPGQALPVLVGGGSAEERTWLERNRTLLVALARLQSLEPAGEPPADAVTALAGDTTVYIPLAGLVDVAAELERLERAIERARGELERVQAKLANPRFVERAPAAVVERERARAREAEHAIERLEAQRQRLAALA